MAYIVFLCNLLSVSSTHMFPDSYEAREGTRYAMRFVSEEVRSRW